MRKSILRFGALALMSLMSISSWADLGPGDTKVTDDGSVYKVLTGTTVELIKAGTTWTGKNASVELETGKSYDITKIGNNAVKGSTQGVCVPAKVTEIGEYAFYGVTFDATAKFDLTKVTAFGKYAFYNATFPTDAEIFLSSSLQSLPEGIFGISDSKSDISAVVFGFPGEIMEVCDKALQNRVGLKNFGYYNAGTYFLPRTLKTIGNHAFQNCKTLKNFAFSVEAINSDPRPRIASVGEYAFENCEWLTDNVFANICVSFANNFEYRTGSFKGCNLKTVDLSGWKTVNAMTLDLNNNPTPDNPNDDTTFNGIPAYAFYGNPITTLKYPAITEANKLDAIGDFAFFGNRLTSISLPEGLQYIGESALESANETPAVDDAPAGKFTQEKLLLPLSLKKIFAKGIGNRKFTGIYAHPSIVGDATYPAYVAATSDNTEYTLYVPAKKPWTEGTSTATKTVKAKYTAAGWVNNTEDGSTQKVLYFVGNGMNSGRQTRPLDNTLYSVTKSCNDGNTDNGGYYQGQVDAECRVDAKSEDKTMTVRGMVSFGTGSVSVGGVTYSYPLVVKVSMPKLTSGTYYANEHVTAITFEPKSVAVDGDDENATKVAGEFAGACEDFAIPESAFGSACTNLASVTIKNGVTSIGENAFKASSKLANVSFAEDATLTSIGASAFAGTTKLTSITLPSTLTKIGASAFADIAAIEEPASPAIPAGLTEITLPTNVSGDGCLGSGAFSTASLKTVKVSYDVDKIPTANGVFGEKATHLEVLNGGNATRDDYLENGNDWANFFDKVNCVYVAFNKELSTLEEHTTDQKDLHRLATIDVKSEDESGNTVYTKTYELVDGATQISVNAGFTFPVRYTRTFASGVFQCWYVPFDLDYKKASDDYDFYYIYNTTQKGSTEANAEPSIELKKVTPGEDVVIKGNTPYIIKPKTLDTPLTFVADAIKKTEGTPFTVTNAQYKYTFNGTYQRIQNNTETASNWYGIGADGFTTFAPSKGINAYRFSMTIGKNGDSPYWGTNVKFVVLDDEDATSIEDVKSGSLSAPMFDLMGRQITAPAKGQVYIQNGVKKLAK